MKIEIITNLEAFTSLEKEWNAFHKDSASAVPFLRHEYLLAWWQTLGGGEWPQGELYIVAARHADGALAGIAPLFLTHNRDGLPALMLLGSIEISDYLDVLARPADLPAFLDALLDHLAGPAAPAWQVLDWYNLLDSSPTIPALTAAAELTRLDGGPGTPPALPLHRPARRLGNLPGTAGRQEAAPRDPPQDAPHRGAERPLRPRPPARALVYRPG